MTRRAAFGGQTGVWPFEERRHPAALKSAFKVRKTADPDQKR